MSACMAQLSPGTTTEPALPPAAATEARVRALQQEKPAQRSLHTAMKSGHSQRKTMHSNEDPVQWIHLSINKQINLKKKIHLHVEQLLQNTY